MSGVPRTAKTANGSVRRVGNNASSNADKNAAHEERFAHLVSSQGVASPAPCRCGSPSIPSPTGIDLSSHSLGRGGVTQRELSARAGVMEPTTFAALKAMAQRGYVTRRRNPQSRKEMQVLLTPQGRALQAKLVPLAEEVNDVALRRVGTPTLPQHAARCWR